MNNEGKNAQVRVLEQIRRKLPQGFVTTNKVAVMKEPNPNPRKESPVWTSWVEDPSEKRYLAILKSNGEVKIIPEDMAHYRSIKM